MNFKCKINETLLRLILIAFNYIFAMLSMALVALGIVYLNDKWWPKEYVSPAFDYIPKLLILLGCLSFIASFVGCYISRRNNKRDLRVFIVLLSILLIFELTLAFISFFNITTESKNITKSLLTIQFLETNETIVNFHVIEENYKCCGVNGVKDYDCRNMKTTCQQIPTDLCKYNDTNGENLFLQITDGCLDKIWNVISYICEQIRICILVLAILQILEIACLFFLYKIYY